MPGVRPLACTGPKMGVQQSEAPHRPGPARWNAEESNHIPDSRDGCGHPWPFFTKIFTGAPGVPRQLRRRYSLGVDGIPGDRGVVPEMVNSARLRNRIAVCLRDRTKPAIPCSMGRSDTAHEGGRPYSWLWFFVGRPSLLRCWNYDRVYSGETTERANCAASPNRIGHLRGEGHQPWPSPRGLTTAYT